MECWVCPSVAGENRISPGPTIYEGTYWMVEHAYPAKMKGWLVLVLKRHAEALHELTPEEFAELADVQRRTVHLAHVAFGSQKEYVLCLAEGEHFHHIHIHIVAKPADLPDDLRGPHIFGMLAPSGDGEGVVPPEEIRALCEDLRRRFPA